MAKKMSAREFFEEFCATTTFRATEKETISLDFALKFAEAYLAYHQEMTRREAERGADESK